MAHDRGDAIVLAEHPHLQGLLLGTVMLATAAAGIPAAVHAAQDLAKMPPPIAKMATLGASPKQSIFVAVSPAP